MNRRSSSLSAVMTRIVAPAGAETDQSFWGRIGCVVSPVMKAIQAFSPLRDRMGWSGIEGTNSKFQKPSFKETGHLQKRKNTSIVISDPFSDPFSERGQSRRTADSSRDSWCSRFRVAEQLSLLDNVRHLGR